MGNSCCVDNPGEKTKVVDVRQERSTPNIQLTSAVAETLDGSGSPMGSVALDGRMLDEQEQGFANDYGQTVLTSEASNGLQTVVEAPEPAVPPEPKDVSDHERAMAAAKVEDVPASTLAAAAPANVGGIKPKPKIPKGMPPPDISETFEVTVTKPQIGARLGMDLSHRGTHLIVRKLYPDYVVSKCNEAFRAAGKEELKEGDVLVAVNDVKGLDQDMLKACRDAGLTLKFNVYRPG
mmetsp:Transcript_5305/g.11787  ORF Transcript_5305/g.11787 Transcript_5305/m.11787 type:complete len:236 (-) Transcript_5305:78-785(-)